MTTFTEVIGRNGYEYDCQHVAGSVYIVGKYLVTVNEFRVVEETLCRATKANVAKMKARAAFVGC